MWSFILRRVLIMIPMMFLISIVCFVVTELQPGDFLSQYLENPRISPEQIESLRKELGLDKPAYERYFMWIKNIVLKGDFGYSFSYQRPVVELIWERLGWTVAIALFTIVFQWLIAIPMGIYSAFHPYTAGDYTLTVVGFIGLSIPEFFMALVLMYLILKVGGTAVGGLFSPQFIGAPWSWEKFVDLLNHIWLPVIVVGVSGLAGLMRIMRGNMLDIMGSPFVTSLRARGLSEKVVKRHIIKNALNPLVSIAGMELPNIFSGTIIASIVLNLPTIGPFFYNALLNHDQYLVMTFLMFIALITQIGNLLADIALAVLDPRIRVS
ncbi:MULTISPECIES: ABC transporter permease [Pseudothermotoga]|jgi:peptide/nickel transport system permease protein|uniref:Binding-protein-dependent transport systems inner membrane component n=1 Tax=Pseudothermotoga lettingae (strain ATCC BAA-301 / DSM 14385 / NBRC 107922 / TMO) TaxID=416591 RepID=A8F7F2_PSELT|nr:MULTISPECIES: ABC transporter permease [Pseudothermotoga]ABV34086.1 binding-protein-dependent transport systems inner membrane component [Pseudothermotoga lettingae TMO]MDI3494669.1 peptide/nickel transport system permease protein [Pseudothermotoga sp.]MDK2884711.1 peptide/nickel transport system permease protein [Pseudothermotoga sp.]GLI48975.1 peptide ABC transporter permease [Pseudothermotoga lettingae TMO]